MSNLVARLGGFPLALVQAGRYMRETGTSCQKYLRLYNTYLVCGRAQRLLFSYMSSLGNSDESASNDYTFFPVYDIEFRLERKWCVL